MQLAHRVHTGGAAQQNTSAAIKVTTNDRWRSCLAEIIERIRKNSNGTDKLHNSIAPPSQPPLCVHPYQKLLEPSLTLTSVKMQLILKL